MDSTSAYKREAVITLPSLNGLSETRAVWFNRIAMSGNLQSRAVSHRYTREAPDLEITFGNLTIGRMKPMSGADDVIDFASQIAANATAHTLTEIACILSRSSLSKENKDAVLSVIALSYLFAGTDKASQSLVRTPGDFIKVATSLVVDSHDFKNHDSTILS